MAKSAGYTVSIIASIIALSLSYSTDFIVFPSNTEPVVRPGTFVFIDQIKAFDQETKIAANISIKCYQLLLTHIKYFLRT